MRKAVLLPAVGILLLALTGCTASKTTTISESSNTPTDLSSVVPAPTGSPSTAQTPNTEATTAAPMPKTLAQLTYMSNTKPKETATFLVPATGYTYFYRCNLDKSTPAKIKLNSQDISAGYVDTIAGSEVAQGHLTCDNKSHTLVASADNLRASGRVGKQQTVAFTGDRMWVESIFLTAVSNG